MAACLMGAGAECQPPTTPCSHAPALHCMPSEAHFALPPAQVALALYQYHVFLPKGALCPALLARSFPRGLLGLTPGALKLAGQVRARWGCVCVCVGGWVWVGHPRACGAASGFRGVIKEQAAELQPAQPHLHCPMGIPAAPQADPLACWLGSANPSALGGVC